MIYIYIYTHLSLSLSIPLYPSISLYLSLSIYIYIWMYMYIYIYIIYTCLRSPLRLIVSSWRDEYLQHLQRRLTMRKYIMLYYDT